AVRNRFADHYPPWRTAASDLHWAWHFSRVAIDSVGVTPCRYLGRHWRRARFHHRLWAWSRIGHTRETSGLARHSDRVPRRSGRGTLLPWLRHRTTAQPRPLPF